MRRRGLPLRLAALAVAIAPLLRAPVAAAGEPAPPGAKPLPLKGRLTVRSEGKPYVIDGPQVVPSGSAIRIEKGVRILGINQASLDVQGGFEVHGVSGLEVEIDGVDFSPTRKPETNFHFDKCQMSGCSWVHGEGESFDGQWTIENCDLAGSCKLTVRLAGGFFRIMSVKAPIPVTVEVLPTKGKPVEFSIRTTRVSGGPLTYSGPANATVRSCLLDGGLEASEFTDLIVDGCDVRGPFRFRQPAEGSFSRLVLTKCNLFAGARLVLDRPAGEKTPMEKVRVERFYFEAEGGTPIVKDKDLAARIDDGADDPKVSVKAFWTKPNERPHELAPNPTGQ
jgi:hypothetical protein